MEQDRVESREVSPASESDAVRPPEASVVIALAELRGVRPLPRGRVRRALVCPYCRDSVDASALVCARSGCGALYHAACWRECQQFYGGCAVYGCDSHRALDLSRPRYLFRVVRLALAALLFPPRVVRALRRYEAKTRFPIRGTIPRRGLRVVLDNALATFESLTMDEQKPSGLVAGLLVFVALSPLFFAFLFDVLHVFNRSLWAVLLSAMLTLVSLLGGAFVLALLFHFLRALASVFTGELGALDRGSAPPESYLARLRSGASGEKRLSP